MTPAVDCDSLTTMELHDVLRRADQPAEGRTNDEELRERAREVILGVNKQPQP